MTIKDIARISGCSVSTISRVINDRPDVRPETKEHVLKVMRVSPLSIGNGNTFLPFLHNIISCFAQ